MAKNSNNRLHPLVVFKVSGGSIINEFCEEKIFAIFLEQNNIKILKPGLKVKINEYDYIIENLFIEYSKNMLGDHGTPFEYEGEFDNFNLVLTIILI